MAIGIEFPPFCRAYNGRNSPILEPVTGIQWASKFSADNIKQWLFSFAFCIEPLQFIDNVARHESRWIASKNFVSRAIFPEKNFRKNNLSREKRIYIRNTSNSYHNGRENCSSCVFFFLLFKKVTISFPTRSFTIK